MHAPPVFIPKTLYELPVEMREASQNKGLAFLCFVKKRKILNIAQKAVKIKMKIMHGTSKT